MGIALEVELITGTYEAHDPRGEPEWPPHPYRLWAAMVAAAGARRSFDEERALEELAKLDPPAVWASELSDEADRDPLWKVFVPSLKKEFLVKGGSGHAARNADRAVRPTVPFVRFVWPGQLDAQSAEVIEKLAARVSYLGRAGSFVIVRAVAEDSDPPEGLVLWGPAQGYPYGDPLRIPRPGLLKALDNYVENGVYAFQRIPVTTVPYRRAVIKAFPLKSCWDRLICWRLVNGTLPAELSLAAADALRSAVLANLKDSCPPVISGHRADGSPEDNVHVGWFTLADIGHEHASGRVMGFGVALPPGVIPPPAPDELLFRKRRFRLAPVDDSPRPAWALQEKRWSGPSRLWGSATPVALPWTGARKDQCGLKRAVIRACTKAGLPRPVYVATSEDPVVRGCLPAHRYVRARGDETPRRATHVVIQFREQIQGPIAIGPLRYFGLGVLVPMEEF